MDNREDELYKPDNLLKRLRLKKNYTESVDNEVHFSDNSNNECEKNDPTSTSQNLSQDDSILDFKSPKKFISPKNTNSNKPINKPKKKISQAKNKTSCNKKKSDSSKQLRSKKNNTQPSIESSFFKTENKADLQSPVTNIKTAYVCPLCFKTLKDESSQAVHMKSCAIKNNVSTKKLLDAVELQERQAAERKSLGLLSAPILLDKKKPVSRKAACQDDPDLQLALALSKSLYEKEEMEILDEAEMIAISSNPTSLLTSNQECFQKATLQSFGFTSNRSISPTNNYHINKMRRRKLIEPTILQRRTAAERECILTERIAEILMGDKDFTQKVQEVDKQCIDIKEDIAIKSKFLQQLHRTEHTLWDKTRLSPNQNDFYVTQLSPQITPLLKKENKLNEDQNITKPTNQSNKESLTDKSLVTKEMQILDTADNKKNLTIPVSTVQACCKEKKFLNTLATNWGNILNDSSASDIIIFVKNNRHIWVHKLVFYVRCTNILLDVVSSDIEFSTVKEKICWVDVDYDVALAFLEFIYCGTINRYSKVLDSDISLFTIRSLSRKYKVNDLFVYLRQRKLEINLAEVKSEETENINTKLEEPLTVVEFGNLTCIPLNHIRDNLRSSQNVQETPLQDDVNIFQSAGNSCVLEEDALENKGALSIKSPEQISSRNNTPTNRSASLSPDIFDDTPEVIKRNDKSVTPSQDHENSNIHVLLNLIKQDADISIFSQNLSTRKTDGTKHLELGEDISTFIKDENEDIIEVDLNSSLDSLKPLLDSHKDSLVDTPRSSKLKTAEEHVSNVAGQKGDLTLFIEKMQRENAKSDSYLDSDVDVTPYNKKRQSNPFHVYKDDEYDDHYKLSNKTRKKLGKLSIIEQDIRSFADKNPEFYRILSEDASDIKQINNVSFTPRESTTESFYEEDENKTHNVRTPSEKDINITSDNTPLSTKYPHAKMTDQSPDKSIYDSEDNEKEISMYSKYRRNHPDNSIAKYRPAIKKYISDGNVSDESTLFDAPNKNIDTSENEVALMQSVLTQKDADIVVSSDTEVESISSNPNVDSTHNDDSGHNDYLQLSKIGKKEDNERDTENEGTKSLITEEISKVGAINYEEQEDIYSITKSGQIKLNTRNITPGNENIEFNIISAQTRSGLNELNASKIHSYGVKFIPSPIMVSSGSDLSDKEDCNKHVPEIVNYESRKSSRFSFNFEDDIYLANVDVDKYERQHILEKSKSASVLNPTEIKKSILSKYNNKSRREQITDNCKTTNDVINYENLDRNVISQSSADIRKLKKKSLSEGQISFNRLRDQKDISEHMPGQFQYNCSQNIGKIVSIIDKDVTPPPDYNRMKTPELHRQMKRYGLKAQKRRKAVKLLNHIYSALHPLVPIDEVSTEYKVTEVSSDEEGPPMKRQNTNDNVEQSNNINQSDELPCSQNSKEMEFYETESLPGLEDSADIKEAFTKLINVDKDLHNKILKYEPVNIEQLHATLRLSGFKCKLPNFMSFLDEQCITFYVPEQSVRNKVCKKT